MEPLGIVLVGIYYAGKTTTADYLGEICDFDVLDLDELYTREFRESIWDTRERETSLANRRRDVIGREIIERMNLSPSVAVLGGGSFMLDHTDVISLVKKSHLVVYLNPTIEALTSRVLAHPESDVRHIFAHRKAKTIRSRFDAYYRQRGPRYLEWADAFVQPERDWSIDRVASVVLSEFVREQRNRYQSSRRVAAATQSTA